MISTVKFGIDTETGTMVTQLMAQSIKLTYEEHKEIMLLIMKIQDRAIKEIKQKITELQERRF